MNTFWKKLKFKIEHFMINRYGMDVLSRDVSFISLILLLVGVITGWIVFPVLAFFGFTVSLYRILSGNISARRTENLKYYSAKSRIRKKTELLKCRWRDRKQYKYYKCPVCRQQIRVPKNRGKIEIRCPKCGTTFIRNTGKRK